MPEVDTQMWVDRGLNVVIAVAILVVGYWLAGWVGRRVAALGQKHERFDVTLFRFLGSVAKYTVLAMTVVAVLGRFGVETTSLVALIGAAGLAVGLALQGTLSNLAAGVMIIAFRPFKVGDFVEGPDVAGKVTGITLFTTEFGSFDNQHIVMPNSKLWGEKLVNNSHYPVRGVDMIIGVAYGADLKKAREAISGALSANDKVLADPAPFIEVHALNESSVDFMVRPFCNGGDFWAVRYSAPEQIKLALDAADVEIPFPQRTVWLRKED